MDLFKQMLSIDSTSGREEEFAQWCMNNLQAPNKQLLRINDEATIVFLTWNTAPKVVFCSHLDTVPPYIAPRVENKIVFGRGSCDAKGQIYALYKACKILENQGYKDFALLLLSGEETASKGAQAFSKTDFCAPYLIIGEPTENKIVTSSKGTKLFDISFIGESFHSGYPQYGRSAVDMFIEFGEKLAKTEFPLDPIQGKTTYNFGKVNSDNPQNVLSPILNCKLYFRTTFASDSFVEEFMQSFNSSTIMVNNRGGDTPLNYKTVEGIDQTIVSFGSDAAQLSNFKYKMICGPGSIQFAHRDNEQISMDEIEKAVQNYIHIYKLCK